jgi:hypothetical protein
MKVYCIIIINYNILQLYIFIGVAEIIAGKENKIVDSILRKPV